MADIHEVNSNFQGAGEEPVTVYIEGGVTAG